MSKRERVSERMRMNHQEDAHNIAIAAASPCAGHIFLPHVNIGLGDCSCVCVSVCPCVRVCVVRAYVCACVRACVVSTHTDTASDCGCQGPEI